MNTSFLLRFGVTSLGCGGRIKFSLPPQAGEAEPNVGIELTQCHLALSLGVMA